MPGPQPPFSIRYTFTPERSIASESTTVATPPSARRPGVRELLVFGYGRTGTMFALCLNLCIRRSWP